MQDENKVQSLELGDEVAAKRRTTRERLLDAGLRMFADKGVDGTSVTDLERLAGLRPGSGSFYRHFSNKEEVLHELVMRETDRARNLGSLHAQAIRGSLGNVRAELILQFRLSLVALEQMRDFVRVLIREEDRLTADARQVRRLLIDEARERKAEELRKRMEAGEIATQDPSALCTVIESALNGYFLAKRYFQTSTVAGITEEQFIGALADLVIGGNNIDLQK